MSQFDKRSLLDLYMGDLQHYYDQRFFDAQEWGYPEDVVMDYMRKVGLDELDLLERVFRTDKGWTMLGDRFWLAAASIGISDSGQSLDDIFPDKRRAAYKAALLTYLAGWLAETRSEPQPFYGTVRLRVSATSIEVLRLQPSLW
jgi:hypothetical protein